AGLGRLLDSRERLTAEQRVWQELSQAFLRISDDVAHARPRGVRDVSGVSSLPAFVGRLFDSRALAEPSLELTRGGELNYEGAPRSDLRRVAYRLKEGRLVRLERLGHGSAIEHRPGDAHQAPFLEAISDARK